MKTVGLVPCAGRGNRLGLPFSKELYPNIFYDGYKPIIDHTIDAMKKAGINHIIFTINPTKIELLKYLSNGKQYEMDFTYVIHPEAKSLPESVNEAYHLIKNDVRVVFAMPDTVIQPENYLDQLLTSHNREMANEVTLGCFKTTNPQKFGMVDIFKEKAISIVDKPINTSLKWMWGAMVWDPAFTEEIHNFVLKFKDTNVNELKLTDALENLLELEKVGVHQFYDGRYRDLGTYDELVSWAQSEIEELSVN